MAVWSIFQSQVSVLIAWGRGGSFSHGVGSPCYLLICLRRFGGVRRRADTSGTFGGSEAGMEVAEKSRAGALI